jgi:acyl-coenzyme A thioesterase PaaI-like protein
MSLETMFLKPARPGSFIATARILSRDERDASTCAELADADGVVVAKAKAKLRILARP